MGSAHNLLAALTDNAVQRGQVAGMSPAGITLRRVSDMEERSLRQVAIGLGGANNAPMRETGFDIVSASEVMAILALSTGLEDLRERLSRMVVGFTDEGRAVAAAEIGGAVGSMMSLLRHALLPNLVQTTEGQPVIVHTGPFGNIAHGCSSIVGDRLALSCADYVLTEAGFGADLGFEKFMHIKDADVAAAAPRGSDRGDDTRAEVARRCASGGAGVAGPGRGGGGDVKPAAPGGGHPVVWAAGGGGAEPGSRRIRRRSCAWQSRAARRLARAAAVESSPFTEGGAGCTDLAEALMAATRGVPEEGVAEIDYAYDLSDSLEDKVLAVARRVYNARDVSWSPGARGQLRRFRELGWDGLPVCVAKTHLSISDRPERKGRPFGLHV